MTARPDRAYMPIAVKRAAVARQNGVCHCGCGQPVSEKRKSDTHFDHEPALRLREVNAVGTDYIPPQNDPRYIDACRTACHEIKTRGAGATTAGTDTGKIKKMRWVEKGGRKVRRPMRKTHRKMQSKPFPAGQKQKIPSRPFRRSA